MGALGGGYLRVVQRTEIEKAWRRVVSVVYGVTDVSNFVRVVWRGVRAFLRLRFNVQTIHTSTLHRYNNCGLATNLSTSPLYSPHHASFPLRFFMSACATISLTGAHLITELCTMITAAVSGPACRDLNFFPLNSS
jgi:hypothetical protein